MSRLSKLIEELCPEGVEWKKLGEVCDIKGRIGFRGYTRQDLVEESLGAISLSPSNIINGELCFDKCTYVSWAKYEESPEIMVNEGDIVFTKTASVGKTALIKWLPKQATINPQLVLLKNIMCNNAYLSYILKGDKFQNDVRKITGVGSVPNVPQSALASIEIPVPPLPVQEEIVRILDKFTTLEAELDCRKRQYEFYRNQLLSFEGERSEGVKWMKLGEMCEIKNGYTPSKQNSDYWEDGTISWFTLEDIRKNGRVLTDAIKHITPLGVKKGGLFPKDSIIISTTATIGEYALIKTDFLCNQQITCLSIKKNSIDLLLPKYLFYLAEGLGQWCKRNVNGGGSLLIISTSKLHNVSIPVPPLSEQRRIVSILDRFEALTTDLQSGLPAEIEARRKQYEYYRERLLTFNKEK